MASCSLTSVSTQSVRYHSRSTKSRFFCAVSQGAAVYRFQSLCKRPWKVCKSIPGTFKGCGGVEGWGLVCKINFFFWALHHVITSSPHHKHIKSVGLHIHVCSQNWWISCSSQMELPKYLHHLFLPNTSMELSLQLSSPQNTPPPRHWCEDIVVTTDSTTPQNPHSFKDEWEGN